MTTDQTGGDPQQHVCKVHRIPTGDYGYTHVWELRNTQLPMSTGTLDSTDHVDLPDSYNNKPTCHDEPRVHGDAVPGRGEHSYECPMLDDRMLLNRVHHHQSYVCPNGQRRQVTDQVSDVALALDERARTADSFDILTTAEAAESNVDGGKDRSGDKATFKCVLNCASATPVSFVVLDQDPMLAKVPLKFENHYL